MKYESVFSRNAVLVVLMSGKKYDVIPQNMCTLIFRNEVHHQKQHRY
jgi:hypothetical protein